MNNIKELQDKPENLKLMAAQRVAYQRAKGFFWMQIIATVIFAVAFNFIRLIPKEKIEEFLPYIILVSVTATIIDLLYFVVHISKFRTNGAKIQEQFDCAVYQMDWNKFLCGSKADVNFIHENYKRYKTNPDSPIENWYDINLDDLSQERAILLCQETNLWYDANLRSRFLKTITYILIGLVAVSVLIGLITKVSLGLVFLYLVAPLLPAVVLYIKIYKENDKSITASNDLKREVLSLKQAVSNPSMNQLRQIQDKIFCNRKDGPLVPEQFYRNERPDLEEGMKINASGE